MYIEDEKFENIKFVEKPLARGEYEECEFINCEMSNFNLSEYKFINCTFKNCDLSSSKLTATTFQEVKFINCEMKELHFENCHEFMLEMSFDRCNLLGSSFYNLEIPNTIFESCNLQEVDFTRCNLTNANFSGSSLVHTTFDNTNLEKADFRNALDYSIDLDSNITKKAKFSINGIMGLLDKYDIIVE